MKKLLFILIISPLWFFGQIKNYYSPKTTVGSPDDPGNAILKFEDVLISINETEKFISIHYVGQGPVQKYSYYDVEYRNGAVCYFLNKNLMTYVSVLLTNTSSGNNLTFMFENPNNTLFIYGPLKIQ